jgi:hypothetical protein
MKWNWYISHVPLFFNSFENRLVLSKCVHVQRSCTRPGRTRDQLLAGESNSSARPAGGMWPGKVVCGPRKFSDTRDLYSSLRMNGDYVRELVNFARIVKFSFKKVLSCNRIRAYFVDWGCMLATLQWEEWEKYGVVSSTVTRTLSFLSTF